MTIGELLKKYRKAQQKTQKEFAGSVVSPSYYAKVEKNIHRITAQDLLALLAANHISWSAFFSHLTKRKNLTDTEEWQQLKQEALTAFGQNQTPVLITLKQKVKTSALNNKEDALLYLNGWLAACKAKASSYKPDPQIMTALQNRFLKLSSFADDEIALFAATLNFYDLDSAQTIFDHIWQQKTKNNDPKRQLLLLKLISDLLMRDIEHGQETKASSLIVYADQLKAGPDAAFAKLKIALCEQLLHYRTSKKKKQLKKIKHLLQALTISGFDDQAKALKKWVVKYKKQ